MQSRAQGQEVLLLLENKKIATLAATIMESRDAFQEFKDDLIRSTILDKEVLDCLISKCVLTLDDREEINSFPDQSSRNQKLVEILIRRPYNTFNILFEALKHTGHHEVVQSMEAKVSNKDLAILGVPNKADIIGIEKQTAKLIKWYNTLVHEMDIDKTGILDKLFAKEVICHEDNETLKSEHLISQDKNRILLGKIIRKNILSAYSIFLEILKEDICYEETAARIEETEVSQIDIELLCIGRRIRERKRNGMNDLMIQNIEKWETDESLYIETKAANHVLVCIQKHSSVSVIGPSGSGKSALVSHVALQMERQGYTILSVTDAKEIKDHYKPDRKTLYIVDDICGNFTANQSRIEEWKKSIKDIKNILENSKCKLILTCRLQVFQDKGFDNLEIFKSCACNLRSKSLSLTSDEKKSMTRKYFEEHAFEAFKHLGEYEFLPLLCKIYHVEKTNPQFTLEMFLNDPFSFYKKDLTNMYNDCTEGKYKYCALLLLVIYNNELEGKNLTGKNPKIKELVENITDVFDMDENITGRKLKNQFDILIGTFVTYDEGIYKTIHDKLFDFLAYYFGTQEQIIDILIIHARDRFIRERFVVSGGNESINYAIPITDDKLQMYIHRVFEDIVSSSKVKNDIAENINMKNVKVRSMLLDFMDQLSKHEITALMEKANSSFLNTMFVIGKKDVKDDVGDRLQEYKCYGIILTEDMFQQYIEKWFYGLIETDSTGTFMEDNRLLTNAAFCTALTFFMKQLTPETIGLCIQKGSKDFLKTMFVITEHDIRGYGKGNKRFGIVIFDDLFQQYIERIFVDFTKSDSLEYEIDGNRALMNVTFRAAFRKYIKQLSTEKIASLIQTADAEIINEMFVMTEEDIKENYDNRNKCFCIVIPDNLLQKYIERVFDNFTKSDSLEYEIDGNRPLMNVTFRAAFRKYIKQLSTEKIASLIQTADAEIINEMFVMTEEDIKENYDNRNKCFCIVIPDNLLQKYIERVFDNLTKSYSLEGDIAQNRPLMNVSFRATFRTYIKKLTKEKIASLIQTAEDGFINTMFVMTEEDIKENSKNRSECFGIVIPDDLLQQYIRRWFDNLTKTDLLNSTFDDTRPLINLTFRTAVSTHIRQLTTDKIASLIQSVDTAFFMKMFVMAVEDISKIAENRYECFGIVIHDDLVQQYCKRLFDHLTVLRFVKLEINENRPLMNLAFRAAFRAHIQQLTTEQIASIIETADDDFIQKMFVMTEDDIKETAEDRYKCFGIVIPGDLLHQYCQRLFEYLIISPWVIYDFNEKRPLMNFTSDIFTKSNFFGNIIYENRPSMNVTFRTAFRSYIRQLTKEKIASLIQTLNKYNFNKMFVMEKEDIKENDLDLCECLCIVIPDDLLQQFCQRLFDNLIVSLKVDDEINKNRLFRNEKFRTTFRTYINQLTTDKIASLIKTVDKKFLRRMFVMTGEEIRENAKHLYECFSIVIPVNLLQQYIQRTFDDLTKTSQCKKCIDKNRLVKNEIFRTAFSTYKRQLTTEKIAFLIQSADDNFINTMFVITEEDIREYAVNRNECFGIVIPDALLQQYCQRLFDNLTKAYSAERYINENRPLMNVTFRTAFCTYIYQITKVQIASLIHIAEEDFFNKMFVMTKEDIKEIDENQIEYKCFGIVIPDDLLQQYCKKLFDSLTNKHWEASTMQKNRPLQNVNFRSTFRTYINELTTEQISSLIQIAGDEFFQKMFVMTVEDIKENGEEQYEYFAIVIPDDLLQQYIKRLFDGLTETSQLRHLTDNIPMKSETFRTAFSTYMRQLTTEQIATLIYTAEEDIFNNLFFIAEEDIKENVENRYKYFGIEIPDNLLQQYIQRLFDDLTKAYSVERNINENRLFMNITFRATFCTYINQLTKVQIASIIQTVRDDFFNTMFVMAKEDIIENGEKRYECFGIVIPEDLLQEYIQRWFDNLTKSYTVEGQMNKNRPLMNSKFQSAFRTYIRQLPPVKIDSLILIANKDFINQMFVMTEEDIEEHADNRYEWFGIVIPDDLLHQYIQRWFDDLITISDLDEFMDKNRPLKNVEFCNALCNYTKKLSAKNIAYLIWNAKADFLNIMFIMSEEDAKSNFKNRYECFSIVIPGDLLQQYIEKWFEYLTTTEFIEFLDRNRPVKNFLFCTALQTFMKQLNIEQIAYLIQTGSTDFLNTMFVMTEDNIRDNSVNRYEWFGIVIPDDLLQQYIERWFQSVTKAISVKEYLNANRPSLNVKFQAELRTYIGYLDKDKIDSIIDTASDDFINTMFVMTEDDIKHNSGNRYEGFGIVIPDDIILLQQYIERWFQSVTKAISVKEYVNANRPSLNVKFQAELRTYIGQLDTDQIDLIIYTASDDFINTMFAMTEDDIKDNGVNRYAWFGIVIPDDNLLLQRYIERWFHSVTEAISVKEYMNANMPLTNPTFRTALRTYMSILNAEEIETLICTESSDFLNTMFVLTENDIVSDNDEYRFESFGIVIPDDMLQQYTSRWVDCMTIADSVMEFVSVNRSSMRVIMQTELGPYMTQINSGK